VFTRGNFAYVPRTSYHYDSQLGTSFQRMTVYVVDLSDGSAPRAVGSFSANGADNDYITGIVQTDNALLVGRQSGGYYNTGDTPRYFYDVFDLADPSAPTKASTFEVPASVASYGWGYFAAGCMIDMGWGWYGGGNSQLTDGDLLVTQHSEPVPGDQHRVKYFLDRVDVSDPQHPRLLPQINIPGSVVHFNADTNELVTIDQQETLEATANFSDCYARGYYGYYESTPDSCRVVRRSLNSLVIEGDKAVRKSIVQLDGDRRTTSIAVSNNRIFYTTSAFPISRYYDGSAESASGQTPNVPKLEPVTLETLTLDGGVLTGQAPVQLRELPEGSYYYGQLYARDERVFEIYDNTVTVLDTLDPEAPTRLERELPLWGCASLEVANDTAYCAAGQRGVEVIDLSSMR
jgi:hypothetical protein